MLPELFIEYLPWLLLLGFCAGTMDAAVGGGGLVQIPGVFTLLPQHTPVASVMGSNKFASFCGTAVATRQYVKKIKVPWRMLLPAALLAFIASFLGSILVSHLPVAFIKPFMLVVLVLMAIYTFIKKDLGQSTRDTPLTPKEYRYGYACGAAIGFYDGLVGPGTGSFLTFLFVRIFHFDFLTATASAKVINLTTNLAALSFFIPSGHVLWLYAIPLAMANLLGNVTGVFLALRGGTQILRHLFLVLLVILIGKFAWDLRYLFV